MGQGEYVFHQGDRGDHFYIIEEGQIECGSQKEHADGSVTFELVRSLSQGSHFGEIALINNVRRTLAVRSATKHTQLLSLNRSTFKRILGSIKQYLREDYQSARGEPGPGSAIDGSFCSSDPDHDDFEIDGSVNGQSQNLYGIQEQEEYEDPLLSDRFNSSG